MKCLLIIFSLLLYKQCFCQSGDWSIQLGLGISGINQVITNDVQFYNKLKFNKKSNTLDNKYSNNVLHSGHISITKTISKGFFKTTKLNFGFAMYNFSSTFFKEDKFPGPVFITINDTINTPNWLITKYTLPYIELGLSKNTTFCNILNIELGFFISYQIDYYGTSHLILFDSEYYVSSLQTFASAKDYTNFEFNHFNYGLRSSISFKSDKKLYPILNFTQSLKDISKEKFHINQHANIWSIQVGLCYNFNHRNNDE